MAKDTFLPGVGLMCPCAIFNVDRKKHFIALHSDKEANTQTVDHWSLGNSCEQEAKSEENSFVLQCLQDMFLNWNTAFG